MGWVVLGYATMAIAVYLYISLTYKMMRAFPNLAKVIFATAFYWWVAIFFALNSLYSVFHLLWVMPLVFLIGSFFVIVWTRSNRGIVATLLIPLIPAGSALALLIYVSDSPYGLLEQAEFLLMDLILTALIAAGILLIALGWHWLRNAMR